MELKLENTRIKLNRGYWKLMLINSMELLNEHAVGLNNDLHAIRVYLRISLYVVVKIYNNQTMKLWNHQTIV